MTEKIMNFTVMNKRQFLPHLKKIIFSFKITVVSKCLPLLVPIQYSLSMRKKMLKRFSAWKTFL